MKQLPRIQVTEPGRAARDGIAWEVEAKGSGVQGHLQPHITFKASPGYKRPSLRTYQEEEVCVDSFPVF